MRYHDIGHGGNSSNSSSVSLSPVTLNNSTRNSPTEEEKRKNFLERNRQAALKCRQRKKAWHSDLQRRVEFLTSENERLRGTVVSMRDEVTRLSAVVVAHRSCGLGGIVVPGQHGVSSSPDDQYAQLDHLISFLGEEMTDNNQLTIDTQNLHISGGGAGGGNGDGARHTTISLNTNTAPISVPINVGSRELGVSVSPVMVSRAHVDGGYGY
ncbi:hypothetical protein FRB95_001759 [Tulasnella sp. JGI-2019a]|nr:hypothetical protein FRB95_001759 [Tulasnella sp. JGI-2019a]